jgi:hypothetical protein
MKLKLSQHVTRRKHNPETTGQLSTSDEQLQELASIVIEVLILEENEKIQIPK